MSCATLGQDVLGKKLEGWKWRIAVICGALAAGFFAVYSSSIIALICATSWTLVAAAMWVPYIALLVTRDIDSRTGWIASVSGIVTSMIWYFAGYAPTSLKYSGLAASGALGYMHPMIIGMFCSGCGLLVGLLLRKNRSAPPLAADAA